MVGFKRTLRPGTVSARLALLAAGLATCASLHARDALTIGEAVRRAVERGLQMQIASEDLAISREGLAEARSAFDPRFSAGLGRSVSRIAADELRPGSSTEGGTASLGLTQSLATGATVGMALNLDRSRLDPATAALNPAYASGFSLGIRQPLLRGLGPAVARAGVTAARIEVGSAERDLETAALDVIRAAETAYDGVAGAREVLVVLRTSLDLALHLEMEAEGRRTAGMATKLDVLQARVGVVEAQAAVQRAAAAVASAEDELLELTGRFDPDGAVAAVSLLESDSPPAPDVLLSYGRAVSRQPDLLSARSAVERARIEVATARDALKPRIDLDLALGFNGAGGDAGGAFDEALGAQRSSWQAGLTLNHALGSRGERARSRRAAAALRRQQLVVQALEQDILVQVREAVRDVATEERSLVMAMEAARLGEARLESAQARFRAGLSTSREVLEARIDLERARLSAVRARMARRDAAGKLRRIEGSGLDYYALELPAP